MSATVLPAGLLRADGETAKRLRRRFPRSLDGAPLLLPTSNTVLRRSLDEWLEEQRVVPDVVAEFEDSALLKAFGQAGGRIFPGPSAIEREIKSRLGATARVELLESGSLPRSEGKTRNLIRNYA